MSDYDALVRFYDLDHVDYDDDLDLYHQFSRSTGGRVLDVGAGTGRVTVHLAKHGAHVVGIDESTAMLDIAAKKLDRAGKLHGSATFVTADVRQLELTQRFSLAIVALNTFAHFVTAGDQFAALAAIHRHLEPGGMLLLDLWNPTASTGKESSGEVLHGYTRSEPGTDNTVSQFVATVADQGRQLLRVTIWYDVTDAAGHTTRHPVAMTTRYCYRYELEWMLLHAGFETDQVYGDYDLSEYHGDSPRLFVTARARF